MISSRKINIIVVVCVAAAIIFTGVFMFAPQLLNLQEAGKSPAYLTSLFNDTDVNTINIEMDDDEWADFLENALSEEYVSCNLTINGTVYQDVGIRCKGNTSLSSVTNDKYSFKFKADEYVDNQSFDGLDEFVVNNIIQDATYMKEYLSYDLLDYMGVATPAKAYYDVYVNGEEWGLYLALETIEEDFINRNFDADNNDQLYKVETVGNMGNMGNMGDVPDMENMPDMSEFGEMPESGEMPDMENMPDMSESGEMPDMKNIPDRSDNAEITGDAGNSDNVERPDRPDNFDPSEEKDGGGRGGIGGMGSNGATLEYIDDDPDSYSNIFDYSQFNASSSDQQRLIAAIKALSTGEDVESYWDVDEVIRYFAVNTAIVNLDSYVSELAHNYYLYEEDGQVSILPWDYNLSFAGYQANDSSSAVNFPVDTATASGTSPEDRPLLNMILSNEEYLEIYHEYLQQIAEEYFQSGRFEETVEKLDALLSNYVEADSHAFYTVEEYETAVETLKNFGTLRAASIMGQLDGSIPSTEEEQAEDSSTLIDASSINVSDMGTQGGGAGGGGRGAVARTRPDDAEGIEGL